MGDSAWPGGGGGGLPFIRKLPQNEQRARTSTTATQRRIAEQRSGRLERLVRSYPGTPRQTSPPPVACGAQTERARVVSRYSCLIELAVGLCSCLAVVLSWTSRWLMLWQKRYPDSRGKRVWKGRTGPWKQGKFGTKEASKSNVKSTKEGRRRKSVRAIIARIR